MTYLSELYSWHAVGEFVCSCRIETELYGRSRANPRDHVKCFPTKRSTKQCVVGYVRDFAERYGS
jgi:hypothetical protein